MSKKPIQQFKQILFEDNLNFSNSAHPVFHIASNDLEFVSDISHGESLQKGQAISLLTNNITPMPKEVRNYVKNPSLGKLEDDSKSTEYLKILSPLIDILNINKNDLKNANNLQNVWDKYTTSIKNKTLILTTKIISLNAERTQLISKIDSVKQMNQSSIEQLSKEIQETNNQIINIKQVDIKVRNSVLNQESCAKELKEIASIDIFKNNWKDKIKFFSMQNGGDAHPNTMQRLKGLSSIQSIAACGEN